MNKLYSALIVIAFALLSCKDSVDVTNDIGYGYFPTNVGHWVIYEIDSTVYDDFQGDTDVYRYQVKEILESEFTDNEGRKAIRVERWKRLYNPNLAYDSIPWYLSRVWAFTRTNSGAEKLQENERFLRLTFPMNVGETWDGNVYNTQGQWTYKYKEVDEPYAIGTFQFDSTVRVQQKLDTNRISYKWYEERYAKNVGMIKKSVFDIADTTLLFTSVLTRIHHGVIYNINLVDYGPR